jgi:hypothetical protein
MRLGGESTGQRPLKKGAIAQIDDPTQLVPDFKALLHYHTGARRNYDH